MIFFFRVKNEKPSIPKSFTEHMKTFMPIESSIKRDVAIRTIATKEAYSTLRTHSINPEINSDRDYLRQNRVSLNDKNKNNMRGRISTL